MTTTIVVMSMGGVGHVQVLLPVIAELRARGAKLYALTHSDFRAAVTAAGAEFLDLYADRPMNEADATSTPIPSRNVTFAGVYAESVAKLVASLSPDLIVYETFTVVAQVVARLLGLPYVNVCPNHALVADRALAALEHDPRVATSDACWAAVSRLREVHGMPDAGPFSYLTGVSPYLNLYCEPAEFLAVEDRAALEPLVFFGCLRRAAPPVPDPGVGRDRPPTGRLRVYVSFGTVIWWYFESVAVAALMAITRDLAEHDVEVLISLGRHDLAPATRAAIERPNARMTDYADQGCVLDRSDLFVTHHGINSTHEAIFRQVPMLSYPFFGDQPALARRCQELGVALPVTAGLRQPVVPAGFSTAVSRFKTEREQITNRLVEARGWELRTMAGRGAVVDRILALAAAGPG